MKTKCYFDFNTKYINYNCTNCQKATEEKMVWVNGAYGISNILKL
jgi:hypothetical protein